ncbi:MAG: nucleotide exchange factor GrpE [Rhodospirillales bacterium]
MSGHADTDPRDKRAAEETGDAAGPIATEGDAAVEPPAAAAAGGPGEVPAADAAAMADRLAAAEAELAQLKDERLRALAEVENVRRRAARDRADASKYAIAGFARDLLSVADNLQRALGSVDPAARDADPALQALVAGVEMTEKELLTVLERNGITAMEALGRPFDPHVHEALFEIPDDSVPAGTVAQVVEPGYMIYDRPLRAARVGVARGGPKRPPTDGPAAGADDGGEESRDEPTAARGSAAAYERQGDPRGEASGVQLDEKF